MGIHIIAVRVFSDGGGKCAHQPPIPSALGDAVYTFAGAVAEVRYNTIAGFDEIDGLTQGDYREFLSLLREELGHTPNKRDIEQNYLEIAAIANRMVMQRWSAIIELANRLNQSGLLTYPIVVHVCSHF